MYRESPYKQSPLLYRKSYKPGRRNTLTFRPAVTSAQHLASGREVRPQPEREDKQ